MPSRATCVCACQHMWSDTYQMPSRATCVCACQHMWSDTYQMPSRATCVCACQHMWSDTYQMPSRATCVCACQHMWSDTYQMPVACALLSKQCPESPRKTHSHTRYNPLNYGRTYQAVGHQVTKQRSHW